MPLKLANNAVSRLSASLSAASTTLGVMPGDGAKFPALTDGDWFPLTIVKSDGTLEIVKATARTSDTFTIVRAQEGTAATDFSAGDRVELRLTKAAINDIEQRVATADQKAETANSSIASLDSVAVKKTGSTGAAILPEGTDAERPAPGATGLYVRLSKTSGKPEWYNRAKSAWQPFGDASGELFNYAWHNGPRSSIDAGRVPADGQQLLLLTHPDVCQAIWAGKQHAVDESVWQADPTKRNCWSRGDGSSWVRVPDLNAAVAGTGKPFYLRGGSDALNGTSVGDAIRNITAAYGGVVRATTTPAESGAGSTSSYAGVNAPTGSVIWSFTNLTFDASKVVPVADENRVKTAYGVMTVRVFTEVSNVGALDAGQLATQLGVVDAKVQALDANTGFTIIYPNGGTAATPANVTINTRYVSQNPFPGNYVLCTVEVLYNGIWAEPGWDGNTGTATNSYGARASHITPNDSIIVQTGVIGVICASNLSGGGHGAAPGVVATTAPCRVKVWKLKGGA